MTELKEKYQHLGAGEVILDVRTSEEFADAHVPGAKNISHEQVGAHAAELSQYSKIYIYCQAGRRCEMAAQTLESKGVHNLVRVANSGMGDWQAAGLPVERGSK